MTSKEAAGLLAILMDTYGQHVAKANPEHVDFENEGGIYCRYTLIDELSRMGFVRSTVKEKVEKIATDRSIVDLTNLECWENYKPCFGFMRDRQYREEDE